MISREVRGLERAMDALSARFQAYSNNVANINTPHYQRKDVDFEDALKMAIQSDSGEAAGGSEGGFLDGLMSGSTDSDNDLLELWQPSTTEHKGLPQRVDGNGSDLEYEMSQMVKTTEKYNTLATQLATQYRTFKYITDQK